MSAKAEAKPKSFPGQHDGEVVELVFHQHPLVMRKQLIIGLLLILVGLLPPLFWPLAGWVWKPAELILLAVGLWWFYRWVGWYYTIYLVTNERLVEIQQHGFFNRKVTEFGLDKIQNINYHINGLQAVLFVYGDIMVQTYVGDLVMRTIYKPVKIHEQIVDIVRRANADAK